MDLREETKRCVVSPAHLAELVVARNAGLHAQGDCGTKAPGQAWDNWFSKEVEKFAQNMQANKTNQVGYTIPVIVHIVHNGEAAGTFPNIAATQVQSQIQVLNDDFNGTGNGLCVEGSQ